MAVTLREVAAAAGVSIRTVSNVVNGFAKVAPQTRERVERAIAELDYRPNAVARSLRQGRSHLIALVLPELDVPYFAELSRLVVEEATERGYTVMIDQTDGDPRREQEMIMGGSKASALFDGTIFSPIALGGADLRRRRSTKPIVLLGERIAGIGVDHVMIDNVAAARAATEHLLSLGRRRVAAIGYQDDPTRETARLRTEGYRRALTEAGLPIDPTLIGHTEYFHRADGAAAMQRLLALPQPPDAVFCYNDLLALGALRVAHEHGLRVPDDIAVVGFDDIEDGRYSIPTLSTISPDKAQIARVAVETLLRRLDGDDSPPIEFTAGFDLVVRESTVSPPRRPRSSGGKRRGR